MKFALRIAAVTGICVLLAGIAWAGPDLLSDSGCDFWNLPRWNEEASRYEKSQEEFGIQSEVALQRVKNKNAVVQALIAGEISSSEAFAQFRVLDADIEDRLRAAMKTEHPGMSDEEFAYWNLLGFVKSSCVSRADGPQILAKLARDWEQEKLQRLPRN